MARRLLTCFLLVLLLATPAAADLYEKKLEVDEKIAKLNEEVERARIKEGVLRKQIDAVSSEIRVLERKVGDVSERLAPLERELVLRELKLNRLNALFELQTRRLKFLTAEYEVALESLNTRIVALYESEPPDTLSVVLSARNFGDFLDAFEYAQQIGEQDRRIADAVRRAKVNVREALAHTRVIRRRVLGETQAIAFRVRQVKALRDRIAADRDELAEARDRQRVSLDELEGAERAAAEEIDALAKVSGELAAKIRAAQTGSTVTPPVSAPGDSSPSSAGLVWPVAAVITSGFGWRWGRMHEGIDLGVGSGTPIRAAAGGVVIHAGWLGGYGNLVVIDHGGGLSTAYGHQSSIAVSHGQRVFQGQVIGYVGSTGNSTGPHLHFEVRVNGGAVDPLGYL